MDDFSFMKKNGNIIRSFYLLTRIQIFARFQLTEDTNLNTDTNANGVISRLQITKTH